MIFSVSIETDLFFHQRPLCGKFHLLDCDHYRGVFTFTLSILRVCAHVWKSVDNLGGGRSTLSFHYVGPRDQTQASRLGSKCPYLLSHSTNTITIFVMCIFKLYIHRLNMVVYRRLDDTDKTHIILYPLDLTSYSKVVTIINII